MLILLWLPTNQICETYYLSKLPCILYKTFWSIFLNQQRSNGTNQGGATQRASALAALNSAFSSSSPAKSSSAPRSAGKSPGSQRAAAIAALSSALSAEKKQPPEGGSPLRLSRTSSVDAIAPGIKIFLVLLLYCYFQIRRLPIRSYAVNPILVCQNMFCVL